MQIRPFLSILVKLLTQNTLMPLDLQNLRQFFVKQGVRTPSADDAVQFIISGNVASSTDTNKLDESQQSP